MNFWLKKNRKEKQHLLLAIIIILQIIIYAPHVGTGFVTDDFVWLGNTVVDGKVDILKPFTDTTGFFRPLVNLTFGVQYYLHGLNPLPYGWFNLLLHLANILLVYSIISSLDFLRPFAVWATALFAINAKGPTMAVGWISGRTTLLFTLFILLSLYLYIKIRQQSENNGRTFKKVLQYIGIGFFYFFALLSKETAAALPIFVFLTASISGKETLKQRWGGFFRNSRIAFWNTSVFLVPLVIYLLLRTNSNAMTPFNAPSFYRYSFSPLSFFENLFEYIFRAGLLELAVIIYFSILYIIFPGKPKPMTKMDQRIILAGSGWFLCFLLPTILIPARSDLYVYIPQIGLHLILLTVIFYICEKIGFSSFKKRKQVAVILPVILLTLVYSGYTVVFISNFGEKGRQARLFTEQIENQINRLKDSERLNIIDVDAGQKLSPEVTVSYGFEPFLKVLAPGRGLRGVIIPIDNIATIKCNNSKVKLLFWEQKNLLGPLNCREMDYLIHFLCPVPIFRLKIEEQLSMIKYKRFYRLKKRKLWLKKIKNKNKNKKLRDRY